jgi:hypothetical protein
MNGEESDEEEEINLGEERFFRQQTNVAICTFYRLKDKSSSLTIFPFFHLKSHSLCHALSLSSSFSALRNGKVSKHCMSQKNRVFRLPFSLARYFFTPQQRNKNILPLLLSFPPMLILTLSADTRSPKLLLCFNVMALRLII